jgi:hypothetical protein
VKTVTQISLADSETRWQSYPVETDFSYKNRYFFVLHISKHLSVLVNDEYDLKTLYDVTSRSIYVTVSRQRCRRRNINGKRPRSMATPKKIHGLESFSLESGSPTYLLLKLGQLHATV